MPGASSNPHTPFNDREAAIGVGLIGCMALALCAGTAWNKWSSTTFAAVVEATQPEAEQPIQSLDQLETGDVSRTVAMDYSRKHRR